MAHWLLVSGLWSKDCWFLSCLLHHLCILGQGALFQLPFSMQGLSGYLWGNLSLWVIFKHYHTTLTGQSPSWTSPTFLHWGVVWKVIVVGENCLRWELIRGKLSKAKPSKELVQREIIWAVIFLRQYFFLGGGGGWRAEEKEELSGNWEQLQRFLRTVSLEGFIAITRGNICKDFGFGSVLLW